MEVFIIVLSVITYLLIAGVVYGFTCKLDELAELGEEEASHLLRLIIASVWPVVLAIFVLFLPIAIGYGIFMTSFDLLDKKTKE